jgi:ABC-type multidrug transport system fused ATPase/permease subunit
MFSLFNVIRIKILDIRDFTTTSWRSIIGVVPQVCFLSSRYKNPIANINYLKDPVLFTGTIASNIAFGSPDATRAEIEVAARQANCDFVWEMPQGFDTESRHHIM